ncbi:uncharacterized protein LOC135488550 [Lineus longissimus]|uniref:uncharacterized protein LOC135488550 n=1 Tax=Lineus longissimus TaxID=88925 RepID=UPI00315D7118
MKSSVSNNQCFVTAWLNGKQKVKFKVDTGSQVNLIPAHVHKSLKLSAKLMRADVKLFSYTGEKIALVGKCRVEVRDKELDFFVTEGNRIPILGFPALCDLNVVTINTVDIEKEDKPDEHELYREYRDVFSTKLDGLNAPKVEIKLKDPKPKQNPP